MAYTLIFLNLDDNVIHDFQSAKTEKVLWKKMNEIYMQMTMSPRFYLKEQLFKLWMDMPKGLEPFLKNLQWFFIREGLSDENLFKGGI